MCGITGFVYDDPARHGDPAVLRAMNAAIRHRGPDSDGFHEAPGVGLAMRRLAIIDLAGGLQPISNEDGTIWIVFNGEIYNFPDLRRDLEARGHVFRTHSDTECIVHAYEEFGDDCVTRLRGMFAFALWDDRRKRLLLGRDRVGKKPLYFARHDGALWFGSEMSCLLRVPGLPRDIEPQAIHHYLSLQYVPEPLTGLLHVRKLPPAHRMIVEGGKARAERYWTLSYEPKSTLSYADAQEAVRAKVDEAVRIRLISEVPLGAHLSGGIDSSVVTALMARHSGEPVRTFSIGFHERAYDERAHARKVSEMYGTRHEEFVLEPDPAAMIDDLADHFGEPFADPAAIPTWHLARMTRRHVTVALNGDGGDEAFAGYQRHAIDPLADLLGRFPSFLRAGLPNLLARLFPRRADLPPERDVAAALRRLAAAAAQPRGASILRWGSYFTADEKARLYRPDFAALMRSDATEAWMCALWKGAAARHPLDRTLATDLATYLPGALLPKVDRMTMAHSLEARSPLLDHEVLELAATLSVSFKVRGRTTKRILRDAFADLLPPGIGARGKMGFGVPLGLWFRGPLLGWLEEALSATGPLAEWFDPAELADLRTRHASGREDLGKRLWALVMLAAWRRRIVCG